jgi:lysine N6-hydroxylase
MTPVYDAIGIGIGPFNLSAAALCAPIRELKTLFVDRQPRFAWHPGLLISGSTIQTSHLKDLVTLADPSSKYSFLSYLHQHGRMYRFITADFEGVERAEFSDYFGWVSRQLDNVRFGFDVQSIDHGDRGFIINGDERYTARHLILGTGLSPVIPKCAVPHLGERVFHGQQLLHKNVALEGKRVAIIGGGQSSAEIFDYTLSNEGKIPAAVQWISSRDNFLPLDDSPFTNELFTPGYSNFFFDLPVDKRLFTVQSQKLASDGISARLLRQVYRRLYCFEFLRERKPEVILRPHTRMVALDANQDGAYTLGLENTLNGERSELRADIVILGTGYEYRMPPCLRSLAGQVPVTKAGYEFHRDFSIRWEGHPRNKMYVQNAAINSRGIADPNLSLMAWRSANIVNELVGRAHYKVNDSKELKLWG